MKQTAVEWFAKELNNWRIKEFGEDAIIGIPTEVFEQAKAMEKEQIMDAYTADCDTLGHTNAFKVAAEQYYNETFKSENIVMFMTPENGEIESIILTDNPDCGVKGITFKSE